MKLKVRKVGNSLTITIPKYLAKTLDIKPQTEVDVQLEEDRIVISKEKSRWEELLEEARKKAKEMKVKEEDVEKAIYEIRYGR